MFIGKIEFNRGRTKGAKDKAPRRRRRSSNPIIQDAKTGAALGGSFGATSLAATGIGGATLISKSLKDEALKQAGKKPILGSVMKKNRKIRNIALAGGALGGLALGALGGTAAGASLGAGVGATRKAINRKAKKKDK